jgi:hypothetical protein
MNPPGRKVFSLRQTILELSKMLSTYRKSFLPVFGQILAERIQKVRFFADKTSTIAFL